MRSIVLSLLAIVAVSLSGCAVYVPPPRAVVVAPVPVVVTPVYGDGYYHHWHRW